MWRTYSEHNGRKANVGTLMEIIKKENPYKEYQKIKLKYKDINENRIREDQFKECMKNKNLIDKKSPLMIKEITTNTKIICCASLTDRYCPCIKEKHAKSYLSAYLINNGLLYINCGLCGKMHPPEGVKIELSIVNNIFGDNNE